MRALFVALSISILLIFAGCTSSSDKVTIDHDPLPNMTPWWK